MYQTTAARVAGQVGPAGRLLLIAIAEHKTLTVPLYAIHSHTHPTSVRELLGRLESLGLLNRQRPPQRPIEPTRWHLTRLGCLVARRLAGDLIWDPRPVVRNLRRSAEDAQDLAIAQLRMIIFRPHAHDLIVTRSLPYDRHARALQADHEYRHALQAHDTAWANGVQTAPPREPEARRLRRRELNLDLRAALPAETAALIPDLYLPPPAGGPYIVEVEMRIALGRHLRAKIDHLAHYQAHAPGTRVIVVYPAATDLARIAGVWLRAIRRGGQPLTIHLTTMDALGEVSPPSGLRLDSDLPGQPVTWTD